LRAIQASADDESHGPADDRGDDQPDDLVDVGVDRRERVLDVFHPHGLDPFRHFELGNAFIDAVEPGMGLGDPIDMVLGERGIGHGGILGRV
jgi:hypothetical protein